MHTKQSLLPRANEDTMTQRKSTSLSKPVSRIPDYESEEILPSISQEQRFSNKQTNKPQQQKERQEKKNTRDFYYSVLVSLTFSTQ